MSAAEKHPRVIMDENNNGTVLYKAENGYALKKKKLKLRRLYELKLEKNCSGIADWQRELKNRDIPASSSHRARSSVRNPI